MTEEDTKVGMFYPIFWGAFPGSFWCSLYVSHARVSPLLQSTINKTRTYPAVFVQIDSTDIDTQVCGFKLRNPRTI